MSRPTFKNRKTRISPSASWGAKLAGGRGSIFFCVPPRRVREKYANANFMVIGAALFAENERYEMELQEAHGPVEPAHDVVQFTGFRTDVADLVAQLDILVHASTIGEPFGQVVAEGMAAGKPTVAHRDRRRWRFPEIIVDGESGLLVPMDDVDAMAATICCGLCGDPDLRPKYQRRGPPAHPGAIHHRKKTARGVEAVWEHVLGTRASHEKKPIWHIALWPQRPGW